MKGFNLVKVLSFILQLGFCSLGVDYLCDNDDPEMSQVIQHFRELGLVFKRKVFCNLFSANFNFVGNLETILSNQIGAVHFYMWW